MESTNSQPNEPLVAIWSRRGFLGAAIALAAGAGSPGSFAGTQPIQGPYPGRSVSRGDPDYERWRTAMPWQLYKAPRYPDAIVRPDHASQVQEVVRRARQEGRQITVKSGGHNVSEAFLRDGGVLLDLGELQALEMSADGRHVWVEPSLWSHGLLRGLEDSGKTFPVSHCATVPMGGFLLGGGIGYNHDNWGGVACHNIIGAEMVLTSGEQVRVSPDQHPDLYWAVRGGGMGLPAVVTRLQLALYDAPQAVRECAAIFTIDQLESALQVLGDWADSRPPDTELMMLVAHNPMATAETPPEASKLAIVRAVTYGRGAESAEAIIGKLVSHPNVGKGPMPVVPKATSLEQMAVESVNPALGLGFGRYAVDTVWTNRLPEMAEALRAQIRSAPSVKSHFVISPKLNRDLVDNAAFSILGETFVGTYTVWDAAEHDEANFRWLAATSAALRPRAHGQYINEVDAFRDPAAPQRCFSATAWKRLAAVRQHYDPDNLFKGWPGTATG